MQVNSIDESVYLHCVVFSRAIKNHVELFANSKQLRISQFTLRKQIRWRFNGVFVVVVALQNLKFGTSRKKWKKKIGKKTKKPGAWWTSRCVVDVLPAIVRANNNTYMKCIILNFVLCASARLSFLLSFMNRRLLFHMIAGLSSAQKCCVTPHAQSMGEWMNERYTESRAHSRQWPFDRVKRNRTVHICIDQSTDGARYSQHQNEWAALVVCLPHTDQLNIMLFVVFFFVFKGYYYVVIIASWPMRMIKRSAAQFVNNIRKSKWATSLSDSLHLSCHSNEEQIQSVSIAAYLIAC